MNITSTLSTVPYVLQNRNEGNVRIMLSYSILLGTVNVKICLIIKGSEIDISWY